MLRRQKLFCLCPAVSNSLPAALCCDDMTLLTFHAHLKAALLNNKSEELPLLYFFISSQFKHLSYTLLNIIPPNLTLAPLLVPSIIAIII